MSDIALVKIKERTNSGEENEEMPGLGTPVGPSENGGFQTEMFSKSHGRHESIGDDKTSGVGTRSLTSEDASCDFGLHQAAREGAVEALKTAFAKILDEGKDILRVIDNKDAEGYTPLHHAAKCNRKEALILLIDNKAYLDCHGEDENTPLHLAAKYSLYFLLKFNYLLDSPVICLSIH